MKYLRLYNESIRDRMTPKSPEDIRRDLMKLSPEEKIVKGTQYNVKDLIETGVEEGGDMEIALRWACGRKGDVEMVKDLLNKGADPNTYLALGEAVNWGHIDIVRILLEAGANPHANMNYAIIQSDTKYGKDSDMSNLLKQYFKNRLMK